MPECIIHGPAAVKCYCLLNMPVSALMDKKRRGTQKVTLIYAAGITPAYIARKNLLAGLVQQIKDGFEGDSAVAAQAYLAGAAGCIALHTRGGSGAVCKGSFNLGAEHAQAVGVQLRECEASVPGKAAAVALNYSHLFGTQPCHVKQHVVNAQFLG